MSIFEEIFWAKLQVQDEHHWSLQFAASRSHPFDSPPPRRESFYPENHRLKNASWEGICYIVPRRAYPQHLSKISSTFGISLKIHTVVHGNYLISSSQVCNISTLSTYCWRFRNPAITTYIKPVVNNGIFEYILPYQLVFAGFLNHQQYHNTLVAELCTSGSANP